MHYIHCMCPKCIVFFYFKTVINMTTKNAFFGLIFFWRCAIYSWQFPSLHPWLCFRQSTAKNMKFKHLHVTTFLEILLHQVAIYWFFYILSIMISEVILFQGAIKPLNIRDIFFLNIGLGMLFVMNSNKNPPLIYFLPIGEFISGWNH